MAVPGRSQRVVRVLDLGSGNAPVAEWLSKRKGRIEYHGVDLAYGPQRPPSDLPFGQGLTFRLNNVYGSLHHLAITDALGRKDWHGYFDEVHFHMNYASLADHAEGIARILKPGGLVFSVDDYETFANLEGRTANALAASRIRKHFEILRATNVFGGWSRSGVLPEPERKPPANDVRKLVSQLTHYRSVAETLVVLRKRQ